MRPLEQVRERVREKAELRRELGEMAREQLAGVDEHGHSVGPPHPSAEGEGMVPSQEGQGERPPHYVQVLREKLEEIAALRGEAPDLFSHVVSGNGHLLGGDVRRSVETAAENHQRLEAIARGLRKKIGEHGNLDAAQIRSFIDRGLRAPLGELLGE